MSGGACSGRQSPIDYEMLGVVRPFVPQRHRHTFDALVLTLLAGRQMEAWLAENLDARQLDTSGYFALSALWLTGPPHRMTAGELAQRIVQTSGGTTKTTQRLVDRRLVRRVADLDDGRRSGRVAASRHGSPADAQRRPTSRQPREGCEGRRVTKRKTFCNG